MWGSGGGHPARTRQGRSIAARPGWVGDPDEKVGVVRINGPPWVWMAVVVVAVVVVVLGGFPGGAGTARARLVLWTRTRHRTRLGGTNACLRGLLCTNYCVWSREYFRHFRG